MNSYTITSSVLTPYALIFLHSSEMEEFRNNANQVLKSAKFDGLNTSKISLNCPPNTFHFIIESDGKVYFVVTAMEYPARLAFQLLDEVKVQFFTQYEKDR